MVTLSRKLPCFLAVLLIFSATLSPAFATELTVFGPTQYMRTTGPPNVYTETFSAFPKEGSLIIENGDEDGKHRVTSALIFINGVQIFAPNDFKQKIYLMEAPVNLSENNNLILVELRSKPGTYLTVRLIQEAEPPTVTINADPKTIQLGESSTLTWTSTSTDTCIIEPGIGSVEVSGSIPVSPTETTTYTITATGPGGTATVDVTVTVTYPPPTVTLAADPETIHIGESTTLTWTTTHADSATGSRSTHPGTIDLPLDGSITDWPIETTTYTLTAIGPGGRATANVTVMVTTTGPPPTVEISAKDIGDGLFRLTWGSTNAYGCVIEPGIGGVDVSGSILVSPAGTTTYTITAIGPGGTATASVTITLPPTVTISADPLTINIGGSSTLTWSSTDAATCVIEPGIGTVDASGSITVSPTETTIYTITATGPGGTATASITVVFSLPTVSLSADPETIQLGESSTLTWTSTNAVSCVIEPGIGTVGISGSIAVSPIETTTYTITATGPGGTATASITVAFSLPTVSLSADPETIQLGESSTLTWTSTNAVSCVIEPSIGTVDASGSITVSPTETTTYIITATGPGGTATDSVTLTVIPPITLETTSPSDGDTISRPDIMVEGTLTNTEGNETGVTVNGIVAIVYGDYFVANHVPLEEGENTITITATDTDGNTATSSITVIASTTGDYIRITADPESGISPLETMLRIEGSFSFTEEPTLTYHGPGEVEFLDGPNENEYNVRMTTEGIYYFTAEVDYQGNTYTDTIAIAVLNQPELDALLKAKWNAMKAKLIDGDIDGAVEYFTDGRARQRYSQIFNFIEENVPGGISDEAQNLPEPIFIELEGNFATYILVREEDGTMIEYSLYFVKDGFGLWKILEY